ncbi:MAG: hypothetical protein ACOY0T_19240 [Myxococcota bacterium]
MRRALRVGVLALLCALPASAQAPSALKVLEGAGTTQGGLFTAGANGARAALPSGATLRLAADGAVRVFGRPQPLELDRGGKTSTWSLTLTRGRLDLDVPAKPKTAVLVSTDKGSVVVMAGKATLISSAGELCVVNAGGNVRTYINSHFAEIAPGRVSRVDAEHPRGTDEALLAAPEFSAGPRLSFASSTTKVGGFAWKPVPDAAGYELELRKGSEVLVRERFGEPRAAGNLAELPPGAYGLAVRALDRRGVEGNWSTPRELRVIGVNLPVGAYSEGDGIFLAGGQKVNFSHTEGLEMTYLGAGRYISASESVGLYRNERTVISFRFPGADDNVIARLEPRDVYAEVSAGPKKAVWPRDHIDLHVRMRTRAGGPVPSFLQVVPRVQLGVEPLEVEWRRENDDFYARVAPQAGAGPWVIRVDVVDQFGIALGRDFVEVARQPGKLEPKRPMPPASEKTSVRVASARQRNQ